MTSVVAMAAVFLFVSAATLHLLSWVSDRYWEYGWRLRSRGRRP